MNWVFLTLIYGVFKGARDVIKKESLKISSTIEVLFFYTLLAFVMCIPASRDIASVDVKILPFVFLKSVVIFAAWILSFNAIIHLPISLYGILDLSRVLFSTSMGLLILGEPTTFNQITGLILVATGLVLLKARKSGEKENVAPKYVIIALTSCLLNSLSGFSDKILTKYISASQLQFYYMLFLVILYFIYMLIKKEEVNVVRSLKNYYIWILALLFVIADKALFVANAIPESKLSIMTLIKQSSCIVAIIAGKFLYHEKNMLHKFICAAIIISGIVIAVL